MEIIDLTLDDDEDTSVSDIECVSDGRTFTNAKLQHDSELLEVLNTPFAGRVNIEMRDIALQAANSEYTCLRPNRLVFWSDASIRKGTSSGYGAGISIVWRGKTASAGWQNKTYTLHGYFNTDEAEFFGIAEAMKLAAGMIKSSDSAGLESQDGPTHLVIYTDNQSCLRWVRDVDSFRPAKQYSITRQRELAMLKQRGKALVDMGIDLELRWVPGHAGVAGNNVADLYAKRASKYGGSVFGGLLYDQLQPVADAYLQRPLTSVTRVGKKLKRQKPSNTLRNSVPEAPRGSQMRLRSAAQPANSSLRRSVSRSHQKDAAQRERQAGKRMERFQKILQMQIKETIIPGSLPASGRKALPITRPLMRDVVIDGVTKKLAKRPPPPSPSLKPRKVVIEEDLEEIPRTHETQPQKPRRTWDRLKVLLKLDS